MNDQRGRTTPFRRDLILAFGAVIFGIIAAMFDLYFGAGDEVRYVQTLLAVFLVALAVLIWTSVFIRNA